MTEEEQVAAVLFALREPKPTRMWCPGASMYGTTWDGARGVCCGQLYGVLGEKLACRLCGKVYNIVCRQDHFWDTND